MNQAPAVKEQEAPKLPATKDALQLMAERLNVSRATLQTTLAKTAFQACTSNEQFISAVIVANTYGLNPLLKEMTVFPGKAGNVIPIVMIDGWVSLVQRNADYDGVELIENHNQAGKENRSGTTVDSITAKFYLKNKSHPVVVTEYMNECFDGSKEPWKRWPVRMLRHKAYIQGARMAFGFSGIYDEDEKDRIIAGQVIDAPIVSLKGAPAAAPQEDPKKTPENTQGAEPQLTAATEASAHGVETPAQEKQPGFEPSSSDIKKTAPDQLKDEINKMLAEMFDGDENAAEVALQTFTSFSKKNDNGQAEIVKGVESTQDPRFNDRWASITHHKIKEVYLKRREEAQKASQA